jgi:tetratricopeptide (TPR) repeat protein
VGKGVAARPPKGESGDSPVEPKSYERISTQLSALLFEMVRTQDVAVAESWSPEVQPGGTIGRFKLVRELGRGGFGLVYEAVDGDLSRTVALKVVKPGTRVATRGNQWLMREAEAVARLNHPNIVTLHDFGQGPTGPYLVFELLRGKTLAERLRGGPMPLDEVIDVGIAVTRALVHAHGAGVVHRDLTAANVHLAEDGAVKVLDFGLAHLFGRDGANDGGTPAYMAPEQWDGDQGDVRTDLFALGVILFQALTGEFPYQVDKGWSEALEPGETPRLPRRAAPGRLRRLVRSMLDREPELRPENARAVRDALLDLRRNRDAIVRRRVLGGALTVAAAAVAVAGWLYLRGEAPPGEQVKVVVAAMENGASSPALEAVPGLLATALEPSPRVRVVPAARLAYVSRAAGLGKPGRIDSENGRELARLAGAAALLVPSAWQEDGKPVLAVKAMEAETGRVLFTAKSRLDRPGDLAAAVDRLSDRIRRELNERADDRRLQRPVAETVTASPEAARFYYEGLNCLSTPLAASTTLERCLEPFERALALDPTFPLAHYQLAELYFQPGDSGERARPHLAAALQAAGRLPMREAKLVQALSARVDGRLDEAMQIYDQLLAAVPDDPKVLAGTAGLLREQGKWTDASRYLEKLVAVEPDEDGPLLDLIDALGRSNRSSGLQAIVARLEPGAPKRASALVQAYVWLGDPERAVQIARRAADELGRGELETLRYALQAAGDFEQLEVLGRRLASEQGGESRRHVEVALVAQGRVDEALRWHEESIRRSPSSEVARAAFREANLVAATGDARRVWRYAARCQALDARYCADLSVVLALLGDVPHGDDLARGFAPGSPGAQQYAAVRAWRQGDPDGAAAAMARAEAADPWPNTGLAPAYLLAEIGAANGDDAGAIAAVARFRRLPPDRLWRAWAYPRALLLSAEAHARLGEREAARAELDVLMKLLAHADPGLALVGRARLLKKQLL